MARIPYPDLTNASEEVKKLAAAMPPLNIFRMLPHMPTFLRGFGQLGTAILSQAAFDARLRELIILRVGKCSPAPYEWQQHVPIGKACGVSDAEIAALERGDVTAIELVGAAVGTVEQADDVEQRRFAGPGRPHDG